MLVRGCRETENSRPLSEPAHAMPLTHSTIEFVSPFQSPSANVITITITKTKTITITITITTNTAAKSLNAILIKSFTLLACSFYPSPCSL